MRPTDPVAIDRVVAVLVILSLVSVYVLPSQSAASFPTYLLPIAVVVRAAVVPFAMGDAKVVAIAVLVLLVYFSSSVWWSSDVVMRGAFSIYSRCVLIAGFVVGAALSISRAPATLIWLGRSVTVGAALAAAAACVEFLLHPTWDERLAGLGQLRNSVVAALTYSAALLIVLDVALYDVKAWRIGAIAGFIVIAGAIAATGSRNGYVSSAVGVWVASLTAVRTPRARVAVWLVAPTAAALAALALVVFDPDLIKGLFPRGDSFRFAIWNAEWQRLVAGNPWFGLGTLTRDRVAIDDLTFAHPHNLYLASALQGGVIGLVTLLTVLGCASWKLVRSRSTRVARLGLSLIVCGATAYLFDGWELIDKVSFSWLVIWLPVSISLALGMPDASAEAAPIRETAV